jgi:hypothetical protein
VESIDAEIAESFLSDLRSRTGFVTDITHVALHGHCVNCAPTARGKR